MGSGVSYVTVRRRFSYFDIISYFDILMYQHYFFPRPNKSNFFVFLSDCWKNLAKGLPKLLGMMAPFYKILSGLNPSITFLHLKSLK